MAFPSLSSFYLIFPQRSVESSKCCSPPLGTYMDEFLFQNLIDQLPDLVFAKDANGRMLVSRPAHLKKQALLLYQKKRHMAFNENGKLLKTIIECDCVTSVVNISLDLLISI